MSSPDYAPDLTFDAGRCGTTYFTSSRDARYCAQNTGPSGACIGGVANCEELGQPIWILKSTWLPQTSDLLALPNIERDLLRMACQRRLARHLTRSKPVP